MQMSTYYEDSYSPEEMEEQSYYGETAYCEVIDHYDWSDNVHGFPTLIAGLDWVSCCHDCAYRFAEQVVAEALAAGLSSAEIKKRVAAHLEAGDYSEDVANRIVAGLPTELVATASSQASHAARSATAEVTA